MYLSSQAVGERVPASLTCLLKGTLKLAANLAKSAVDRLWRRKFLGPAFTCERERRVRATPQSVARFKESFRQKSREGNDRNPTVPARTGAESPKLFQLPQHCGSEDGI